ncbi:RNA polymerase sigma factor [Virgibacillus ndiopensis]|uniref:RNA polymerase sigma factor n=1 Tax=Virgibacillus ndiopensis TaxID=2004408 RepID=UPI000C0760D7|nr:RNA polymerase sigma factor [Virgibacillus ndiopensis]
MRPLVNKSPIGMNEEFEDTIKKYLHDLRKYCLSLTKTKWDGEDLMQDTLVKAYKSWLQKPKPIAKAYLLRIASNTWIDRHRKRKLDEDLYEDMTDHKHNDQPAADAVQQAIGVLLNEFSSKQRVVLLLVEGFGYTPKETANMLSVTEGSIKAVLHRARKRLKNSNGFTENDYLEEDESWPYITALRSGSPDTVIQLYHDEINSPVMSSVIDEQHVSPLVQTYGTGSTFYVLVSILRKNGDVVFVPFYRSELSAVLAQIAMFRQQELLAVA